MEYGLTIRSIVGVFLDYWWLGLLMRRYLWEDDCKLYAIDSHSVIVTSCVSTSCVVIGWFKNKTEQASS